MTPLLEGRRDVILLLVRYVYFRDLTHRAVRDCASRQTDLVLVESTAAKTSRLNSLFDQRLMQNRIRNELSRVE